MKKLNFPIVLVLLCSLCSIHASAQWGFNGNNISSGQYLGVNNNVLFEFRRNSNQVLFFDEYDNTALGRNNSISADFSNSIAIGNNILFYNQSSVTNTFALGNNIYAFGDYYGGTSVTIGSGVDNATKLETGDVGLFVGFNSNIPTFYVGPSSGAYTTGNVGIGMISPVQKLDINGGLRLGNTSNPVNGSLRFTGADFEGFVGGTWKSLTTGGGAGSWVVSGPNIYSSNAGNVGIGTTIPENGEGWERVLNVNGAAHSKIIATTTNSNIQAGIWAHSTGFYSSPAGGMAGTKTNSPFSLITNGTNRMTILANGAIGIGTSAPSGKLEVSGLSILGNPSGADYNENLRLPVAATGYSSIALGAAPGSVSGTGVGQWTIFKYPAANNHTFSIRHNSSDLFSILSTGNVGIGTVAPTQALEVKGNLVLGNAVNGNRWLFESRAWAGGDFLVIAGDKPDGSYDFDKMMSIERATGKVVIGPNTLTMPGNYRLYVKDGILTEKVRVAIANSADWADFVFASDYKLRPLKELESFIATNKHLPEIPSADQVVKEGVDLTEMDARLLQKIEELTLYIIEQNKRIEKLEAENKQAGKN